MKSLILLLKGIMYIILIPFNLIDFIAYKFVIRRLRKESKDWIPELNELVFIDDNGVLEEGNIEVITTNCYYINLNNHKGLYPKGLYPKDIVYRNKKYIKIIEGYVGDDFSKNRITEKIIK